MSLRPDAYVLMTFGDALWQMCTEVKADIEQLSNVSELIGLVRKGMLPRQGRLASGIQYHVHGIGCEFVGRRNEIVDIDFAPDGTPIFDAWRLRRYLVSLGQGKYDEDAIVATCQELVAAGKLVAHETGWFAFRPGPRDK